MYTTKDLSFNLSTIVLVLLLIVCSHKLFSQEISTVAEIYDFEVGDEFHINELVSYHGFYVNDYGHYSYTNIKISEKYFGPYSDTLYYSREIKNVFFSSDISEEVYSEYSDTITITDLNNLINYGEIDSANTNFPQYNGRVINYLFDGNSSYFWKWKYVAGCGLTYRELYHWEPESLTELKEELVYFKKGNEEWGTPNLVVSTNPNIDIQDNIEVFPNPAKDYISIKNNKAGSGELDILSLSGQVIKKVKFFYDQKINISELKPGIYILQIEQNGKQIFKKLIKE